MIESAESEREGLIKAGKITANIADILSNFIKNKKDTETLKDLNNNGIWVDGKFYLQFYGYDTIRLRLIKKQNDLEFSFGYTGESSMPIPTITIKCLTFDNKILAVDIKNIIERRISLLHEIEHACLDKKLPPTIALKSLGKPQNPEEYQNYIKTPKELDSYTKQILAWVYEIINEEASKEEIKPEYFRKSDNVYNFLYNHGFFINSKYQKTDTTRDMLKSLQKGWLQKNNKRLINKIYEQLRYISEIPDMKKKELEDLYDYYVSLDLLNLAVFIKTELEKRKNRQESLILSFDREISSIIDEGLNKTIIKEKCKEEFSTFINNRLKEIFSDFEF